MKLQETNSPFTHEQIEYLNQLLPTLTEAQKMWLNGFLAAGPVEAPAAPPTNGAATATATATAVKPAEAPTAVAEPISAPPLTKDVTVLYGSQTGNSETLAEELSAKLKAQDFNVTLSSMDDFKPKNIKNLDHLFVVVSTHGEGDPPDTALSFYEFLHGKKAPKLDGLNYSVLALGDSSYEYYCQTGKDFDKRLEELGASRLTDRVDCDVDFDEDAAKWANNVLESLQALQSSTGDAVQEAAAAVAEADTAPETPVYSRTNPFYAEVLDNVNLNGRGSNLETHHIELSLEGSNLHYEPGDCLAIYPENHPSLVNALLENLSWSEDESVTINKQGDEGTLREALSRHYEITVLTKPLLKHAAEINANEQLQDLVKDDNKEQLREYINGRDLLDLVTDFGPWNVSPQEFVKILRKMPPRLYSIASSENANPDEVHLTIRTVRYHTHGRDRFGVCSVQCAENLEPGDTIPVYIQKNPNFKLPEDPETPIVMIGPGTGIAPFRSFVEEREEIEADGKSWLFFGDQHFRTDFLYQTEWQKWLKDGVLTRMDVAFSRDTAQKVYVQDRMKVQSAELFNWIEEGAHIYVCGDKNRMAKDVHATLAAIISAEGNMSEEEAEAYLTGLKKQKRYQRDVY
ncbi:assimilatory sulfite reductase (NADPH) flavoprotein subunit [Salsuginibacillus kocurii]|uniref:assimilatory sulfite reductase (NADPH) flavoprotein subunit n=1 Tax=Salsuginibacillus kocurii TaxID=427078 RepID=UPI000381A159|nr:assimilatory sulfite reductase (NADPH) flavoprotein subunit [Salsuginibacillus kocurii]